MAELTISATDIAGALKKNLEGFEPSVEARTVGRVAEVGDQPVLTCGFDILGVQIDRHHLLLVRVHQAFRNALSGRAETDDQD